MTGLGQCRDHLTIGMRADAPLPMVICDERECGEPSPRYALGPLPRLGPGFRGQQLPVSLSVAGLPGGHLCHAAVPSASQLTFASGVMFCTPGFQTTPSVSTCFYD